VAGSITDHKCLLDRVVHPFQANCFVEAALDIFWRVSAACSFSFADKSFDEVDVFGEFLYSESFFVLDITVSDECYTNFKSNVLSLDLVDDFFKSIFASLDPTGHARCAVHQ